MSAASDKRHATCDKRVRKGNSEEGKETLIVPAGDLEPEEMRAV